MQSIEIPIVTQTRVSDDYSPSNSQWINGDTTIIAHAVGLASFKDVQTGTTTVLTNIQTEFSYYCDGGRLSQ